MSVANERVQIQVGDTEVRVATTYEVRFGIFETPGSFSLQLGSGISAQELINKFPKNSPFQIYIGTQHAFAGFTDGVRVTQDAGATEVALKGRGTMKFLHDSFHEREASYVAASTLELIEKALNEVNILKPFPGIGQDAVRPTIRSSNAQARLSWTGVPIFAPPSTSDDFSVELQQKVGTVGNAQVVLRAKLGERWADLIQRNLNQHGLFIWEAEDGDLVVGRPNPYQKPLYRIVRQSGKNRPAVSNVISCVFEDDIQPRYSEVVLFGRSSGRKFARTTAHGGFTDDELVSAGVHKVLVMHDVDVTSTQHAELMARRRLAEGRRQGFYLEYTLSGHTTLPINSPRKLSIIWAPDTVVEVHDEELGLQGNFWIESVRHRGGPSGRTTTIRLHRPEDLLFGTDIPPQAVDLNAALVPAKKAGVGAQLLTFNQNALFTAVLQYRPQPGGAVVSGKELRARIPTDVLDYFRSFPQARVFEVVAFIRTSHPDLMKPPTVPIVYQRPTTTRVNVSSIHGKAEPGGKVSVPTLKRKG